MQQHTFVCDGCGSKLEVEGSIEGMRPPKHDGCGKFLKVVE